MPNKESLEANITILYVEDDPINQLVLKSLLNLLGYKNILCANDASTALDLLKNSVQPIDLIFMDLGLPDMDGITLTGKIRQSDLAGKNVPIIALTGNLAKSSKEKSLAAGMSAFLEKPITAEQLRNALNEVLN